MHGLEDPGKTQPLPLPAAGKKEIILKKHLYGGSQEFSTPVVGAGDVIMSLYIQYGCGWSAPKGRRNFDTSPMLCFERLPVIGKLYTKNARHFAERVDYGHIERGLTLADNSADGAFASHILERMRREDAVPALHSTIRILKPAAIFRIIVPDLYWRTAEYVKKRDSGDARASDHWFLENARHGQRRTHKSPGSVSKLLGRDWEL